MRSISRDSNLRKPFVIQFLFIPSRLSGVHHIIVCCLGASFPSSPALECGPCHIHTFRQASSSRQIASQSFELPLAISSAYAQHRPVNLVDSVILSLWFNSDLLLSTYSVHDQSRLIKLQIKVALAKHHLVLLLPNVPS